jgi:hypothetical protein
VCIRVPLGPDFEGALLARVEAGHMGLLGEDCPV